MKYYYKIVNGYPQEGSGIFVPEGFSEYPQGQEPQDLLAARKPTLEATRLAKLTEINEAYDTVMDYIQAGYPLKEVLSWDIQYLQAKELLTTPDAEALFIRQLATQKNISVEEMRDRILANAESWQYVAGLLTAQRQIMEETALLAESVEELDTVKVAFSV